MVYGVNNDLSDLVDSPRETLDVELKGWIDLADKVARAKIARHIAALANHGGGYLVFGFRDDLSRDPNRPIDLAGYNRDEISGIVRRYLTPPIDCTVAHVAAIDGAVFPVVRVPGHGATPIAAKADGPSDPKGRPQGISVGTHYIRKIGPESAPIIGPDEWGVLIRRCVLAERDALLGQIASIVQPPTAARVPDLERLADWHARTEARFHALLEAATPLRWPVPIRSNRCQLSYVVLTPDREVLPASDILPILDTVNREVRETVWTGWSMFYPFMRPEIAPALHAEAADGTGMDVLEANLMGAGDFATSLPDLWRFAPDGRASLIRPYREDRPRSVQQRGRPAGSWLSPETILRETTELVVHARQLVRHFETAHAVAFKISWMGLMDRELADFDPAIYWSPGRIARADLRTTTSEWAVAALSSNWHGVVAELACPVLRLFGFNECSSALVEGMANRFIKL